MDHIVGATQLKKWLRLLRSKTNIFSLTGESLKSDRENARQGRKYMEQRREMEGECLKANVFGVVLLILAPCGSENGF